MLFLLPLLKHFGCYGNWKFPLTYNKKSENWYLLLSHCRYFDKSFAQIFELSSTKYIHFIPNLSIWLVAMATEMLNLRKKY